MRTPGSTLSGFLAPPPPFCAPSTQLEDGGRTAPQPHSPNRAAAAPRRTRWAKGTDLIGRQMGHNDGDTAGPAAPEVADVEDPDGPECEGDAVELELRAGGRRGGGGSGVFGKI